MREIEQMVEDLDKAMKAHAAKALSDSREVAEQMADSASALSTPMYGYLVHARATHAEKKSTVTVRVQATGTGIGKVYGGEKAMMKKVESTIAMEAMEGDLEVSSI